MTGQEMTDTIREMMKAYLDARDRWIELNGNDDGFDEWFTKQCNVFAGNLNRFVDFGADMKRMSEKGDWGRGNGLTLPADRV